MNKTPALPLDFIAFLERRFMIDLMSPKTNALKPVSQTIRLLSEQLSRPKFRKDFTNSVYLNQPAFRQAYLLYFSSCNLLKIHFPLDEISHSGFFENKKNIKILDLGTGTGTLVYGSAFWFQQYHPHTQIDFTAIDQSAESLKEFETDFRSFKFPHTLRCQTYDLERILNIEERYDLIIGANFLNELSDEGRENVLSNLQKHLAYDGFVILIEPALLETSRVLLNFRDRAVEKSWSVYAPCFTKKMCPALQNDNDWCHHDWTWERPAFIEVIDELIGNIKKSLKFSYVVLTQTDRHLSDFLNGRDYENQFRVVSELFKEKGRKRIFLCNDLGRKEFVKNNRDDSESNSAFDQLERYDLVQIRPFEIRKSDVKILEKSEVLKMSSIKLKTD
ncbi:small ribosomal subunit Rsm22 family protein [bacterium]|nr:small ribosomal subunit Rsm22 family protein [bacterium]